jgi:hypothetical protein
MSKMVKCGDDKSAPGGMICVHLATGASKTWVPVTDLDRCADLMEIENDWLCPDCANKWPYLHLDEVTMACIHCIRELRQGGEGDASEDLEIVAAAASDAEVGDQFYQMVFEFLKESETTEP